VTLSLEDIEEFVVSEFTSDGVGDGDDLITRIMKGDGITNHKMTPLQ
jgi:hypothetical protein